MLGKFKKSNNLKDEIAQPQKWGGVYQCLLLNLGNFQGHFGGLRNNSDEGNVLHEMDTKFDVFWNIISHRAYRNEQINFKFYPKILAETPWIDKSNAQLRMGWFSENYPESWAECKQRRYSRFDDFIDYAIDSWRFKHKSIGIGFCEIANRNIREQEINICQVSFLHFQSICQ